MNSEFRSGPGRLRQFIIQHSEFIIVSLLTGLCLWLGTANSTLDAWYYAACARHGHELLLPHHLLYNAVGWLWAEAWARFWWSFDSPLWAWDALFALKRLNALAAGASLLVLRQLLRLVLPAGKNVWPWLLLAGASFGVLRFATENEAYIQPVLLSLLGSLAWARYQLEGQKARHLVWAGCWAALACLFHQIHFCWWLGLLLSTGWYAGGHKLRALLLYSLPALLVPAAYVAALPYWHQPLTLPALWRFVFHDYYAGTATGSVSGHGMLLSVVNLGRTFVQVHGSTLALLRLYPGLWLVVVAFLGLLAYAGGLVGQGWRQRSAPATQPVRGAVPVVRAHLLILGLQLLFAVYSEGNAEFMVMVPALLTVVAGAGLPWLPARAVATLGLALLGWNLAFGLVPSHYLRFTNTGIQPNSPLLRQILLEPNSWFLLDNHNLTLNQLHYRTGRAAGAPNVLPAPTLLVQRPGQSPARLRQWLRAQLQTGHRVFTTGLGGPQLLDRAQLVYGNQNAELLRGFRTEKVDSFPTAFGPYYLTEIR
ncbi:hypothetical protein E5K00_12695 [Hymenobacter aquaticus]|uniref:Glycosyltransferase RgtA/B/C/D-like domain-containing protein n=1 Tax=Hymenobacter aquaticus TaxID=1867101 RepID=A0A4Z0Q7G3_9BACT|nr:hypothetical protein [Hymenobacter aquaticus]TGE26008.1 hypothetical protein E5K00_12695 [Hymenobacter aquaticus]